MTKEKEIKKKNIQQVKRRNARQKKRSFYLDIILIVVCFLAFMTAAVFQVIEQKLHKERHYK